MSVHKRRGAAISKVEEKRDLLDLIQGGYTYYGCYSTKLVLEKTNDAREGLVKRLGLKH